MILACLEAERVRVGVDNRLRHFDERECEIISGWSMELLKDFTEGCLNGSKLLLLPYSPNLTTCNTLPELYNHIAPHL